jgi:hypothetical protein
VRARARVDRIERLEHAFEIVSEGRLLLLDRREAPSFEVAHLRLHSLDASQRIGALLHRSLPVCAVADRAAADACTAGRRPGLQSAVIRS